MAEGYIYRIIAPGSRSVYVGQSTNPLRRLKQHRARPCNPALANFLRKHPDAEIYFWPVLDMAAEEIADEAECRALGFNVLNCAPCGGKPPGHGGNPETLAKIAAASRGRECAPETRSKISAALMGHVGATGFRGLKHMPEARAKMSKTKLGKPLSSEHRANIGAALKGKPAHGKPHTQATRAKISASLVDRTKTCRTCRRIGHNARTCARRMP